MNTPTPIPSVLPFHPPVAAKPPAEEMEEDLFQIFASAARFMAGTDEGTKPERDLCYEACLACLALPAEVFAAHPAGLRARAMVAAAIRASKGGA